MLNRDEVPFVINSLDNESQGWTNGIHIFIHQLLDNGSLSGIVQPSSTILAVVSFAAQLKYPYNISILISLSFKRALRRIDSILIILFLLTDSVRG